jgi:hypothetical protein
MDLLLEIFYPKSAICKNLSGGFSSLLGFGGRAKRKEQSAKRKAKDFLSHEFPLQCFEAPCSLPLLHTI